MKNIFAYFSMVVTILLVILKIGSTEPPSEISTSANNNDPILAWGKKTLAVLVIKEKHDTTVLPSFINIINWLIEEKSVRVLVEEYVKKELFVQLKNVDVFKAFQKDKSDHIIHEIDFIICVGRNGTLFYATSLFPKTVPPVMLFPIGTSSFLTQFKIQNFKEEITNVIEGNATYLIRNRLDYKLIKNPTDTKKYVKKCSVLNEVTIGHESNHLFSLSLYIDGHLIADVEGNGLVISTPTGSTEFSASAGSSLIHPKVSAILLSAINPRVLSLRSVVVPADTNIKIMLAPTNTPTDFANVTLDNENTHKLNVGVTIEITSSKYPVKTINPKGKIMDWFSLLTQVLNWNVRPLQKALEKN